MSGSGHKYGIWLPDGSDNFGICRWKRCQLQRCQLQRLGLDLGDRSSGAEPRTSTTEKENEVVERSDSSYDDQNLAEETEDDRERYVGQYLLTSFRK